MSFPEQMDCPFELPTVNTESRHYQQGRKDALTPGVLYSQYYAGSICEATLEHIRPEGAFEYHQGFLSATPEEVFVP